MKGHINMFLNVSASVWTDKKEAFHRGSKGLSIFGYCHPLTLSLSHPFSVLLFSLKEVGMLEEEEEGAEGL